MRALPSISRALAALVVLGACSSELLPPAIGDCSGAGDASCAESPTTSVAVSGGDGGSSICNAGASASQCDTCANAHCCTQLSMCTTTNQCNNLLSCVMGCGGASACIDGCNQTYPASVPTLEAIDTCLTLECAVCAEAGVGDPCTPGASTCVADLTCSALGCTQECAHSSDCGGIGANGGNLTGQPNACIATAHGEFCSPGCATNDDCARFPGTFCATTTSVDSLAVSICSTLPDGG
jgi:hypothetical protein